MNQLIVLAEIIILLVQGIKWLRPFFKDDGSMKPGGVTFYDTPSTRRIILKGKG